MILTRQPAVAIMNWLAWPPRRALVVPVELCALRYGFLPACFRHRGTVHRVARIERIWEHRGRGRHPARRFFAVHCAGAQPCTLVQELHVGTWQVIWPQRSEP